jgi:hypothetical protein
MSRIRARLVALPLLLLAATPLAAQYPALPSPVLDLPRLSREVRLSGYLAVRLTRRNDSLAFLINRARLTAMVAPQPYLAIRVQGDLSASGRLSTDSTVAAFTLTDAYLQLSPPDSLSFAGRHQAALIVGQFRTPFSAEYLSSLSLLQSANRSLVVDRASTRRDIGAFGQVRMHRYLTLAAALVNGGGPNVARNLDGREMALARLTLTPRPDLAFAVKLADEGGDHLRGYDARWVSTRWIVEGEALHRNRPPVAGSTSDAGGGYVLASWRARPWLQPKVKWEQYQEMAAARTSATWVTAGVNLLSPHESLRVQLEWIRKTEHPIDGPDNELVAQFIAIY